MQATRTRAPALEALRVHLIVGRANARLSQVELADRAGVGRNTLSRIESGSANDVTVDVVQRLADALGVDVANLFILPSADRVDDDELARRAAAPADEFIEARAFLRTVDEAAGAAIERYSSRGRRSLAR